MEAVYERLYNGGAKGGTVYVDGSRDAQVLTLKAEENHIRWDYKIEEKVFEKRPICFNRHNPRFTLDECNDWIGSREYLSGLSKRNCRRNGRL